MSIATNLQRLVDAKSDIADAITAKGGTVNQGDGFEEFPADIASIPSGENPLKYGATPVRVSKDLTWTSCPWTNIGSNYPYGNYMWKVDGIVYYSSGTAQYYLNKSANQWSVKSWSGLTSFYGNNVWSDGTDIYYSSSSNHYVLNKSTSTWSQKTWTGLTSFSGSDIWRMGDAIYTYSSSDNKRYQLDKTTSTWLKDSYVTGVSGLYVWSDGKKYYYSNGSTQYEYDDTYFSKWKTKTWSGDLTSFLGSHVWSDGNNVFYSNGTTHYIYIRDRWNTLSVSPISSSSRLYGNLFWTDGECIYYTGSETQIQATLSTPSILQVHCRP